MLVQNQDQRDETLLRAKLQRYMGLGEVIVQICLIILRLEVKLTSYMKNLCSCVLEF